MGDSYVINQDTFERAIPIIESRSFMEQKESKQILLSGLCQLEHFKSLMRDPLLEHHLYPYLDQFAQQVSYKYIPRGRIIYHDNENIGCLFFILRGSFTEFKLKSEDDLQKELYWDSQAEQFKQDLAGVTNTQRNLQDKRTKELILLNQENEGQKNDELMNNLSNSMDPSKMSAQQKQILFIRQKIQEQELNERKGGKNGKANRAQTVQLKKQPTLEEVFFTEEYKKQSRKLKEAGDLALENEKFYSGSTEEQLLKMENKHQERYFRDHRCIYKKTRELQSGQSFGELYGNVDNTVICSKNAFLLSISAKIFLEIFEALTERLNYVFHALANSFPSTKKVILFDFAFQFTEQHLEYNQILFDEGDSPANVYIMKAGEIDYRKKLSIFGLPSVKRLSMINQGDIFGQEDIFGPGRSYSVHSCVNNSVVYRIKKEALFLFQFMASLKSSVKSKAESLAKKLIELQARNSLPPEEQIINAVQSVQGDKSQVAGSSIMTQADPANPQKSSIMSNLNNHQSSQVLTGSIMSSSMVAGRNSSQVKFSSSDNKQASVQSKDGVNSVTKIPSMSHLPSSTASYFFQTKNANLGESDYDLAFQSVVPNFQHRSTGSTGGGDNKQINDKTDKSKQNDNSSSNNNNNAQKGQQQSNNLNNLTVQPSRAQPESVYSRIVRPDSAFKEEIEQMKKEQAEQLLQFNSSQTNIENNSTALHSHSILRNKGQKSSSSSSKYQEFKLNRLPKDKFALSLSIVSDTKLTKKDSAKLSDQQQALNPSISSTNTLQPGQSISTNPSRNNQSIGGASTYVKSADTQDKINDNKIIQLPIRTASSLKKYKDYTQEYFDKDQIPKQLDFFTEFQNYKQDIQAKLLFERNNRKEVKDDPFAHINFNVVEQSNNNIGSSQNLEAAQLVLGQKSSSSKRDSRKPSSSSSSLSQKQLQYNLKNVRINPEENVDSSKRQKQGNSMVFSSQFAQKTRSSEGLHFDIPTESDDEAEQETLSPGFKSNDAQLKSSLAKGNNNNNSSSFKEMNSSRKIRFVHPCVVQDQQRMKPYFKPGNKGSGITSSPNLSSREVAQEQSVPFRIRDHQDDLPRVFDKANHQGRNLMNSKIEAEKNVLKHLESSLSFGNLRAAAGFRLGHPSTAQPTSNFHSRSQLKK